MEVLGSGEGLWEKRPCCVDCLEDFSVVMDSAGDFCDEKRRESLRSMVFVDAEKVDGN